MTRRTPDALALGNPLGHHLAGGPLAISRYVPYVNPALLVADTNNHRRSATSSVGAWPVANRAMLYPVFFPRRCVLDAFWLMTGTAGSAGNIDMGLYLPDGEDGQPATRLASIGSTAHGAANTLQVVTLGTAIGIAAGWYWFAYAHSVTTASAIRTWGAANASTYPGGMYYQYASAVPLPASLTAASLLGSLGTGNSYWVYAGARIDLAPGMAS